MKNHVLSAAAAAALLVPSAAAGQARENSQASYNLVQLSVPSASLAPEEFKTKAAAIRSCAEAVELAAAIDAEVTRNPFVLPSQLPPELNAILKDLPAGQATPVFSGDGKVLRVIVLCGRN